MNRPAHNFLKIWCITCAGLLVLVSLLNALIDPYELVHAPKITGLNAHKPVISDRRKMFRNVAYGALNAPSNTLLLGASVVFFGMDAQSQAWPPAHRPVYSLAFPSAGPYVSYRYLQHVLSQRHVNLVILGLEFDFFLDTWIANPPREPEFEARFAVTQDGNINPEQSWRRLLDLGQAIFALDTLFDSAATLKANSDYLRTTTGPEPRGFGSYPLVAYMNVYSIRAYDSRIQYPDASQAVRNIFSLCESAKTRLIVFINPTRAERLEILDRTGYWQAYENWKRELVSLTSQHAERTGNSLELWDFSGYDPYATEEVRPDGRELHWFFDSVHYSRALGDVMIARMLGAGDKHYGALLSPDNIESHLAAIREQQRLYRKQRPDDVQRIEKLFDTVRLQSRIEHRE